jgi:hypothetical protein
METNCSSCNKLFPSEGFSKKQLKKPNPFCKMCVAAREKAKAELHAELRCSDCREITAKGNFSHNQVSRGAGARCKSCVDGKTGRKGAKRIVNQFCFTANHFGAPKWFDLMEKCFFTPQDVSLDDFAVDNDGLSFGMLNAVNNMTLDDLKTVPNELKSDIEFVGFIDEMTKLSHVHMIANMDLALRQSKSNVKGLVENRPIVNLLISKRSMGDVGDVAFIIDHTFKKSKKLQCWTDEELIACTNNHSITVWAFCYADDVYKRVKQSLRSRPIFCPGVFLMTVLDSPITAIFQSVLFGLASNEDLQNLHKKLLDEAMQRALTKEDAILKGELTTELIKRYHDALDIFDDAEIKRRYDAAQARADSEMGTEDMMRYFSDLLKNHWDM